MEDLKTVKEEKRNTLRGEEEPRRRELELRHEGREKRWENMLIEGRRERQETGEGGRWGRDEKRGINKDKRRKGKSKEKY